MAQYNDYGPRCPNHLVPLTLTDQPGIGICPISNCRFTYNYDDAKRKKVHRITTAGELVEDEDWEVTEKEGEEPI